jgi:acyl carrier protein
MRRISAPMRNDNIVGCATFETPSLVNQAHCSRPLRQGIDNMNAADTNAEVVQRISRIVRSVLSLGDDVELTPEADLIATVGIDSIEAFESIAMLHDMLGVRIPDDLDPKRIGSVQGMATYISERYDGEVIRAFLELDVESKLEALRSSDDF